MSDIEDNDTKNLELISLTWPKNVLITSPEMSFFISVFGSIITRWVANLNKYTQGENI